MITYLSSGTKDSQRTLVCTNSHETFTSGFIAGEVGQTTNLSHFAQLSTATRL